MESTEAKKSTPTAGKSTQVADIGCIQHSLVQHFVEIEDPVITL